LLGIGPIRLVKPGRYNILLQCVCQGSCQPWKGTKSVADGDATCKFCDLFALILGPKLPQVLCTECPSFPTQATVLYGYNTDDRHPTVSLCSMQSSCAILPFRGARRLYHKPFSVLRAGQPARPTLPPCPGRFNRTPGWITFCLGNFRWSNALNRAALPVRQGMETTGNLLGNSVRQVAKLDRP
jgi:hypothetical protein